MTNESNRPLALITGAAVGIGKKIAEKFAESGYDIALTYLNHEADDVIESVKSFGVNCYSARVDATDTAAINVAVSDIIKEFGRLDVLVTNVGGLIARQPMMTMTDEHWHKVVDVNLSSTFYFIRAAAPHMQSGGRIVTLSSLAGQNGGGDGASAYAASKAGVIGLTKALARELGPRGITVNTLTPGFIDDTPFHATFSSDEAKEAMVNATAVKRAGIPEDVANAALYLASPGASFVTGIAIDLNGGAYYR